MDPKIREIITLFKQLDTTTSARRITYHQIINELGPNEWRDVKERINKRSFQKDILGSLPLELAVQIIQYLSLDTLHLLRRVSKRWCEVLSSQLACSTLFRLYTGASLTDDFESTLAHYARRRRRLQQGDPRTLLQIDLSHLSEVEIASLGFSDGKYVWLTDNETTIVVYVPETGKKQRFCTEHRERIEDHRLSESMVAAVTMRGYCYAWDLQTEEPHMFRLPNRDICLFYVKSFRITLYFPDHCTVDGVCGFIIHFDLQSKRSHTIQHIRNLALMSLDVSSGILTTICLGQPKNLQAATSITNSSCLHVVDYELREDGNYSTASSYFHALPLPRDQPSWDITLHDIPFPQRNNMAFLHAQPAGDEACAYILPVTYKSQTQKVCVHMLPEKQLDVPPSIIDVDDDIIYWVKNDGGKRSIWISNPYAEPSLYTSRNMSLDLGGYRLGRTSPFVPLTSETYVLVGDSRLVTVVSTSSTRAWSFQDVDKRGDRTCIISV